MLPNIYKFWLFTGTSYIVLAEQCFQLCHSLSLALFRSHKALHGNFTFLQKIIINYLHIFHHLNYCCKCTTNYCNRQIIRRKIEGRGGKNRTQKGGSQNARAAFYFYLLMNEEVQPLQFFIDISLAVRAMKIPSEIENLVSVSKRLCPNLDGFFHFCSCSCFFSF